MLKYTYLDPEKAPVAVLTELIRQGVRNFEELDYQIKCVEQDGLCLLAYTKECNNKPPSEWKAIERVSRGLIIDTQGNLVALPFEKFFNAGQVEEPVSPIQSVTEKMDGSLGILYRVNGEHRIATRGSFTSDQAKFATEFLTKYDLSGLPEDATLLFEIIYPENRVVIDYKGFSGLYLIGSRSLTTRQDDDWGSVQICGNWFKFPMPKNYAHVSLQEVTKRAAQLDANEEGFVIRYADGTRLKVKGEEYLKMHRFISNFSLKAVAQAIHDDTAQESLAVCPEHYQEQFIRHAAEVSYRLGFLRGRSEIAFQMARDYAIAEPAAQDDMRLYRKRFAEVIMRDYKDVASYAFALLDKRDIEPMIYRNEWEIQ